MKDIRKLLLTRCHTVTHRRFKCRTSGTSLSHSQSVAASAGLISLNRSEPDPPSPIGASDARDDPGATCTTQARSRGHACNTGKTRRSHCGTVSHCVATLCDGRVTLCRGRVTLCRAVSRCVATVRHSETGVLHCVAAA